MSGERDVSGERDLYRRVVVRADVPKTRLQVALEVQVFEEVKAAALGLEPDDSPKVFERSHLQSATIPNPSRLQVPANAHLVFIIRRSLPYNER